MNMTMTRPVAIAVPLRVCRDCGQPIVYIERLRGDGGWVHIEAGDWARCSNFRSGPKPLPLPTIRQAAGRDRPVAEPTSRPAPPAA